ncbi:MAG: 4Fe-4S dicluster domain-containing protein [Bacteriovoracaceae bacterium]|nr:4Fe-4S dicluster domain-containing protein [Bacteriovoracaceae bacterium]
MIIQKRLYRPKNGLLELINVFGQSLCSLFISLVPKKKKQLGFNAMVGDSKRGHNLLFDENDKVICDACLICAKSCPTSGIHITAKGSDLEKFEVDILRCIYCRNCQDVCPLDALKVGNKLPEAVEERDWRVEIFSKKS